MQLIRGSLLHKFLTEGLCKIDDSQLQGVSRCTLVGLVGVKFLFLSICTFFVFGFFFGNFFNFFGITWSFVPPTFLVVLSIVAMVLDALLLCVVFLIIVWTVGGLWGAQIKSFWDRVFAKIEKPFKKIDCGVVQVLDKRIEK